MASTAMQGGDIRQTAISGWVGVGAGIAGGTVASNMTTPGGHMSLQGIRKQNYVTNILSGAGDRMVKGIDAGISTEDVIKNTIWGGVEGAISARMFSSDKFLNFGRGLSPYRAPVVGRYLSGFMSNALTSNPGASFMAARVYGSVYPTWMFGQMNSDLFISIFTSLTLSPWFYMGGSAIQAGIVGPNYPYAYDFLDPNYWR
jgi:hypothetical protein